MVSAEGGVSLAFGMREGGMWRYHCEDGVVGLLVMVCLSEDQNVGIPLGRGQDLLVRMNSPQTRLDGSWKEACLIICPRDTDSA